MAMLVLLCLLHLSSSLATYYVRPTVETPCFNEDCYTLSEIANNTDRYIEDNTTIVLLPGVHTLNSTIIVLQDLQSLTLTSNPSSFTNATEISCMGASALIFRNVFTVLIKALIFTSCGNVSIPKPYKHSLNNSVHTLPTIVAMHVLKFRLLNSTLVNCHQSVYSCESNVVSNSNLFANNQAREGAAIHMIDSNFTFIGCNEFMENSATGQGGAIYSSHSNVLFKGSVSFISNRATFEGGSIYAVHSNLNFGSVLNISNFKITNLQKHIIANSALREFSELDDNGGIFAFTRNSAKAGGALYCTHGTAALRGVSVFENNSAYETPMDSGGGAVALNESSWFSSTFVGFAGNSAPNGGALYLNSSHWISQSPTVFLKNFAKVDVYIFIMSLGNGGAVHASNSLLKFHGKTEFVNNTAEHEGGGIYILSSNLTDVTTSRTLFSGNKAEGWFGNLLPIGWIGKVKVGTGGGIHSDLQSLISFQGSISFLSNSAYEFGGAVFINNSTVNLTGNSKFQANSVKSFGGGIRAVSASLTVSGKLLFSNNSAGNGGAMSITHGQLHILGKYICTLAYNKANGSGGGIHIVHSYFSLAGSGTHFYNNSAGIYGGAVAGMAIAGHASGEATFSRNFALFGAAVALLEGNFSLNSSSITFTQNSASLGGAVYLDRSNISMTGNKTQFVRNLATQQEFGGYGGAIYSSEAAIYFIGVTVFEGNSATSGGALVIAKHDWKMLPYFLPNSHTYFHANHANMHGGAIMVEDTPLSYCGAYVSGSADLGRACFFRIEENDCRVTLAYQLPYIRLPRNRISEYVRNLGAYINFAENTADYGGSVLYGGAIENCRVCLVESFNTISLVPGLQILAALTYQTAEQLSMNRSDISSDALEVCICENVMPICSRRTIEYSIHPGKTITIPLVTVGQLQGKVPGIVNARFESSQEASLDRLQNAQQTNLSCTPLQYTIFSRLVFPKALLTLFAEGPCGELGKKFFVVTNFLPCPVGFVLSQSQGACICEERLQKYTNSCDIDSRTITRNSDFWVGYDDQSPGLILHSHCPFDYCTLKTVSFTLNSTDQQCAHGRSGTLCGVCKYGLSLNLGSSRCSSCSNTFVLLLLPFIAAGFLLVIFLFTCKITVSAGTTSGLIFYANVIAVNRSVFFPPGEANILTVFIAWLNLDLGIETCFFDGMGAYTKMWLQFVFPLYIWSLVGLISLTSHYSMTIAKIIGPTNPVAVLATLFLLSYTKLLRTIIATFSFTTLDYPDDHKVPVWAYDGNIGFCEGKHAALFVVGLMAFLFVFLPYTLLLLCGQFIIARSNYRVLSWANKRTCKSFLDAYYAPYKNGYRYWTGLLLVIRLVLFTLSAVIDISTPKDPSINLLVLAVTCIALTVWIWNTGNMYKKWYRNALESSFILNLAILAATSYQVKVEGGNRQAVSYTSVGVAFVTFLGIIAYHVIEQARDTTAWKYSIRPKLMNLKEKVWCRRHEENVGGILIDTPAIPPPPKVTTTFVELREPLLESQN